MTENKQTVADQRQQLFNQGEVGPVVLVSTMVNMIGQLRAIMFDIDLKLFRKDGPFSPRGLSPEEFYERYVQQWLDHHPLFRNAEIRFTGSGFHVILWFDTPVQLPNDNIRKYWQTIVSMVQAALPIDPRQPKLNALTRPIGSINSKNRQNVRSLREGRSVSEADVHAFFEEIRRRPLATMMKLWFGDERVSPCPVCKKEDSYLEATDSRKSCFCYKCGKVSMQDLVQSVLEKEEEITKKGDNHVKKTDK